MPCHLPSYWAPCTQAELVSGGLEFQRCKKAASLVPHLGSPAFEAAAAVGPDAASVLGGPLLAGEWQQHSHHGGA